MNSESTALYCLLKEEEGKEGQKEGRKEGRNYNNSFKCNISLPMNLPGASVANDKPIQN
jgi:hypothetical protein